MAFKLKGSHLIALAIAGGLSYWMATGEFQIGGQSDAEKNSIPIAEREAERSLELFKVRYVPLVPETRSEVIRVRGRTQADAVIPVRAETAGVVQERMVAKGDKVSKGDLVCRIEAGAREAQLAQAKAQLANAETEFTANSALQKKGFASQNRLTALQAAMDAAKAGVAAATLELNRTQVRANADGVVQDPIASVGEMLTMGGTCITLIDADPMLFTGQVSERDIARIQTGMEAKVELISGEVADGKIRYIAPSADAQTRTFEVEIEISDRTDIRDGMTAEAKIALAAGEAFRIAPSWVTLADDGAIGIRRVNTEDIVEFVPVKIVAQEKDGFWITGPNKGDRIITLGQEYVVPGEKVIAAPDERIAEKLAAAALAKTTKNGTAQ